MIDFSQTIYELLVVKSFQKTNWEKKTPFNRLILCIVISPLGPLMIGIKKLLKLVQGISIVCIQFWDFIKSDENSNRKEKVDSWFDGVIE